MIKLELNKKNIVDLHKKLYMKRHSIILIVFLLIIGFNQRSISQNAPNDDGLMETLRSAFKSGNQGDIVSFFNSSIELCVGSDRSVYQKSQAEQVMKNFFIKYPPVEFEFKHHGSSGDGLKYFIGTYTYKDGSYTSLIRMKPSGGKMLIHKMEFTKE